MPILMPPQELKFPSNKEAAEELALRALFSELRKGYVPYELESWSRHPKEDGPDFNIRWREQNAYLEATELAPLTGPYASARRLFSVEEMAVRMDTQCRVKHNKYESRGYKPLFLLIYITDDAFYPTEEVLLYLAHLLQMGAPLVFEAIFFVSFWADGRVHLRMPYPHEDNLCLLNVERLRGQLVVNPNILQQKIVATGSQSITVRQYLPEGFDINRLADSIKALLK